MTHLHPDTEWLTDYAAGSLADSHALCVSAHLTHCPTCAAEVARLNAIGGVFLGQLNDANHSGDSPPATPDLQVENAMIEKTLAKATSAQHSAPVLNNADSVTSDKLPAAFSTLAPTGLDNLHWKTFGKNLSIAEIDQVDSKREVALHRLEPGAAVAHHDHRGREITVVLTGSFSDRNGQYYPGDFIVRQPGDQHQPTASENTACVCLSVTDAPVRFTGMLTRLLNPVLALRHPR